MSATAGSIPWWLRALLTLLATIATGLFLASIVFMEHAYAASPLAPAAALRFGLTDAALLALLAPIPLALARRWPIVRRRWLWTVPLHLVCGLFFAAAHLMTLELTVRALPWVSRIQPPPYHLHLNLLVYAALVAAAQGIAMHQSSRQVALRAAQLETSLAEARLDVLQSQLRPHFLFNTLNAISELMHEDLEAAETMIARLSDLLRASLDDDGIRESRLDREMQVLDHYLAIERVRFGDRMRVTVEIDEAARAAAVPSFVLQPLVENAVRHGVALVSAPTTVAVTARRDGATLCIRVENEGRLGRDARPGSDGEGVGLANTRERLRQLYGDRHTLSLEQEGDRVVASLTLPFRRCTESAESERR